MTATKTTTKTKPKAKPAMTFAEFLEYERACDVARGFVGNKSVASAWRQCKRGDWMLWLLETVSLFCADTGGLSMKVQDALYDIDATSSIAHAQIRKLVPLARVEKAVRAAIRQAGIEKQRADDERGW